MKYRTFPGTGIAVSEIGFGTWTLATGWWGEKSDAEAVEMLRRAHDEFGINFFDAADSYGNGRSERQPKGVGRERLHREARRWKGVRVRGSDRRRPHILARAYKR